MADYFPNADFNGDAFVVGAEGERYERNPTYVVPILADAAVNVPTEDWELKEDFRVLNPGAPYRSTFMLNNFRLVRTACDTDREACAVAAYRMLAVKYQLISHAYTADAYNLNYVETVNAQDDIAFPAGSPTADDAAPIVNATCTRDFYNSIVPHFFNYIALLAWVFRVRGHHYMEEFEPVLVRVWKNCLYAENTIPIRFQVGFTVGLHAIPPVVLEKFWIKAGYLQKIAGTMIKRLDSAPAGAAIISTIKKGLDDIQVVLPYVPATLGKHMDVFEATLDAYKNDVMAYSINARLYGKVRARYDENSFSLVATFIVGVYKYAAENSALLRSPALMRVADQNPVTMGLLQKATAKVVDEHAIEFAYGDILKKIKN